MAAVLEPRGAGVSGQQPNGIVAQYQLSGKGGVAELSSSDGGPTGIGPYDSGSIIGHVQPGGASKKLVDGTIQRATDLICDSTAGVVGNALQPTAASGNVPTIPTGQGQANGLSLGPEFE